jgi:hypothetical protein
MLYVPIHVLFTSIKFGTDVSAANTEPDKTNEKEKTAMKNFKLLIKMNHL